jgi:hypothetical protein
MRARIHLLIVTGLLALFLKTISAREATAVGRDLPSPKGPSYAPRLADLMGANGTLTRDNLASWKEMGFSWSRLPVPWHTIEPKKNDFDPSRGMWGINNEKAVLLARDNKVQTLMILGYTALWASIHPDVLHNKWDGSYFLPRKFSDWENYVEKIVSHFSQPPYNVKYFQIWNEPMDAPVADRFWKGTKERFIDSIHIPAARIIRKYGCHVVFGGWPASLVTPLKDFSEWLNYHDLWKHVDYLSVHYRGEGALDYLYPRWIENGKCKGIWITEYGFVTREYLIPNYFFPLLTWALNHQWDHPDKYKAFYYAMPEFAGEGAGDAELAQKMPAAGRPLRATYPHGQALRVLKSLLAGELKVFKGKVEVTKAFKAYPLVAHGSLVILLTDEVEAGREGKSPGNAVVRLLGLGGKVQKIRRIDVHSGDRKKVEFVQETDRVEFTLDIRKHAEYVEILWSQQR